MILWTLAACGELPAPVCAIESGTLSFPEAQGFGTTTPGGRFGQTWIVDSLADDGPGSLREAVEAEGPRTVVFAVSGEIALRSQLEVVEPYLTIAGQSAPGDGVVLSGAGVVVFTHDVVIRYLRVRPGMGPVSPENNDGMVIMTPDRADEPAHHVVLDHVSLSWSEDELLSTLGVEDLTLSWSILSEALNAARHPKGEHSAGLLLGFGTTCATVHHTLLAHNGFRNPLLTNVGRIDYVDNVAYDYGDLAGEVLPDVLPGEVNLVGNRWIQGPSSNPDAPQVHVYADHPVHASVEPFHLLTGGTGRTRVFAEGNAGPNPPTLARGFDGGAVPPEVVSAVRFDAPAVEAGDGDLLDLVLAGAGATVPARDAVDQRIVDDVVDGTGSLLDDPADVGGLDRPAEGAVRVDADRDGLPDDWELANGLSPADPADALTDPDGDGVPVLEDWLNALGR